jgi:hypothetical protein
MKVNVSVEATAQEMREFLGLPNIQPLHDDLLQALRDNMQRGVINFDALGLLKPLLPTQFNSMEMVQKFWEAVAKASGGTTKDAVAKASGGGTTKGVAEKKPDNSPEPRDDGAARDSAEKPS